MAALALGKRIADWLVNPETFEVDLVVCNQTWCFEISLDRIQEVFTTDIVFQIRQIKYFLNGMLGLGLCWIIFSIYHLGGNADFSKIPFSPFNFFY